MAWARTVLPVRFVRLVVSCGRGVDDLSNFGVASVVVNLLCLQLSTLERAQSTRSCFLRVRSPPHLDATAHRIRDQDMAEQPRGLSIHLVDQVRYVTVVVCFRCS